MKKIFFIILVLGQIAMGLETYLIFDQNDNKLGSYTKEKKNNLITFRLYSNQNKQLFFISAEVTKSSINNINIKLCEDSQENTLCADWINQIVQKDEPALKKVINYETSSQRKLFLKKSIEESMDSKLGNFEQDLRVFAHL